MTSTRTRVTSRWVVGIVLAVVGSVALAGCGSTTDPRVAAFDPDAPELQGAVDAALAARPDKGCVSADALPPLPSELGALTQVCRAWGGVRFESGDPTAISYYFGERRPSDPSTCIRELGRGWWAIVQDDANDPADPCPGGFEFQGA